MSNNYDVEDELEFQHEDGSMYFFSLGLTIDDAKRCKDYEGDLRYSHLTISYEWIEINALSVTIQDAYKDGEEMSLEEKEDLTADLKYIIREHAMVNMLDPSYSTENMYVKEVKLIIDRV